MKYSVIFLALFMVSFLSVNHAYGVWLPQSPQELLEESQVIFVGNITFANELELEQPLSDDYPLILDEYTVNIEEFVKNPQDAETITVRQPTVSTPGRLLPHGGFEIGDRVLFYIESFDGTNTYSKESFLIPRHCDTSSVINEPRIIGGDYVMMQNGIKKQDNFTTNLPIQFVAKNDMGTLSGASLEYDVFISKQVGKIYKDIVFNQTITADAKLCKWLSVAEWEFTPDVGNYLLNGRIYENGSSYPIGNKFFSVFPEAPLKQIKAGVALFDVVCSDEKIPAYKYDNMNVACVDEETHSKLISRGWALLKFVLPDENPSHALCNRYDGKWHPELEGCRGITDFQCSLIGGKFITVDRICYNEICADKKTDVCTVNNVEEKTNEDMLSSKYTGISDVEKLLMENQIDYLPDTLVVTGGPSIRGDPGCGAVIDVNSTVHWFGIDSISNPERINLFSENPNQCKANTSSCFCNAQIELTAITIDDLDYFTPEEQEHYANILIDYLYNENINRTPKFMIGKLNINYSDSSIGYCGEIWGTNTYGFFEGQILNDTVMGYGIDKELPLLCAISDDAMWWENEN